MGGPTKSTVEDDIVVTVSEGKLRGTIKYNKRGRKFFAFLSVPYAIPPVEHLRFKVSVYQCFTLYSTMILIARHQSLFSVGMEFEMQPKNHHLAINGHQLLMQLRDQKIVCILIFILHR